MFTITKCYFDDNKNRVFLELSNLFVKNQYLIPYNNFAYTDFSNDLNIHSFSHLYKVFTFDKLKKFCKKLELTDQNVRLEGHFKEFLVNVEFLSETLVA